MVIRPLLSIVELGLEVTGNLETWHVPITIILNLSVSTAVCMLVNQIPPIVSVHTPPRCRG